MSASARTRSKRPAVKSKSSAAALHAFPWRRALSAIALIGLLAALLYHEVDMEAVHRYAERLPGGVAFLLLTVLPLLGFPASLLHVVAGIRFGIPLGLALVAASILLQLLASYALVHRFHDRFAHWLAPVRERIPEGAHASICVLTVLLPGAPFAAVNYVLPLLGVPLRTYLLCCLPLHVLRSTVTVTFGDQSDKLTGARLVVLASYALLILGASWWTYRRLRVQLGDRPSAADGRKRPA
jgi:uncharacterized membrane protein YdjX (TVP38/TMEM64 family)